MARMRFTEKSLSPRKKQGSPKKLLAIEISEFPEF